MLTSSEDARGCRRYRKASNWLRLKIKRTARAQTQANRANPANRANRANRETPKSTGRDLDLAPLVYPCRSRAPHFFRRTSATPAVFIPPRLRRQPRCSLLATTDRRRQKPAYLVSSAVLAANAARLSCRASQTSGGEKRAAPSLTAAFLPLIGRAGLVGGRPLRPSARAA